MRHRIECGRCGGVLRPKLEAVVVFHECRPPEKPAKPTVDSWADYETEAERIRAKWSRKMYGIGAS